MNRPIILWDPRRHTSQTSDEAGTTISKSIHPPAVHEPGPYESKAKEHRIYYHVPSLGFFALKSLCGYPEQVHALGSVRLRYQAPSSPLSYNILRELIPFYDPNDPDFDLAEVDPRLWATLVQVYFDLPDTFRTYHIPLSDKHVPLLQQIPSTPHFSLITILELPKCPELTDDTVVELRCLSGLCAFDASGTTLSAYGVKNLSRTLMWSEDDDAAVRERRGPWAIRILNLQNCKNVDNGIFNCLPKFVLLSVIDLRGTRCNPNACDTRAFRPSSNKSFFHPSPLSSSLALLSSAALSDSPIFSSPDPYTLHITSLNHSSELQFSYSSLYGRRQARSKPPVSMQDAYVVLPPSQSYTKVKKEPAQLDIRDHDIKPKIKVGNSHTLERRRIRGEEMERHERNKEAWYERNEHWARDGPGNWGEPDYEDPCGDGEPCWGIDEDSMPSESEDESEDGSEDDVLDDETELDLPLNISPQADVNASTLRAGVNSDTRSYVSQGGSSGPSASSSEGRLSATSSQLSHPTHPTPTDRPAPVSDMPGPRPVSRKYRRRPQARAQLSEILSSHPNHNADILPGGQWTIPTSNNVQNDSKPNGQMTLGGLSSGQRTSTILDVPRTQPPETSRSVRELDPTSQPDPSHPILPSTVAQPSRPDEDIRMSIALEEADIHATRQATAAFYLQTPVGASHTPSARHVWQRPSVHLRQSRERASTTLVAGELLMLFRDPPPWSTLENSRMAASASHTKGKQQRAQESAAVLGGSNTTGAAGVKGLLEMVKRRKLSEVGTTVKVSNQPQAVINTMPRNPFRKNPDPEDLPNVSGQDCAGKNNPPAPRPPLAAVSAAPRLNSVGGSSAKSFKPISALAVPALPEQSRLAQSKSGPLPGQASTSRNQAMHPSLSKKVVKKSNSASLQSKAGSQGPLPDLLHSAANLRAPHRSTLQGPRISIKSSDNMSSRRKSRSEKGPASFDWKGWSGK